MVEGTHWVLLTINDVTERHAAEAALRDSETRYRIVADNTYNWEYWQSPEGMFLYVSPSCERISGIPAEDFMASAGTWERIIHPEDRHVWDAHRCRAADDRVPEEVELRIRRPDGEVRWIGHVCHPVFDDRGVFLGTRGGNCDITDRKRIEQELHRQARFLQVVIDAMPAPVVIKDPDGAYIGCNRAYLEFLGRAKNEVVGKTVYDLFPVDQAAVFQEQTLHVIRSPGTLRYEARMRHADGSDRDVIASLASFNDDRGRVSGLVGVVLDITERKRAEEALRQSHERLERVIAGTDAGCGTGRSRPERSSSMPAGPKWSASAWRSSSPSASRPGTAASTRRIAIAPAPSWKNVSSGKSINTKSSAGCGTRTGPGSGSKTAAGSCPGRLTANPCGWPAPTSTLPNARSPRRLWPKARRGTTPCSRRPATGSSSVIGTAITSMPTRGCWVCWGTPSMSSGNGNPRISFTPRTRRSTRSRKSPSGSRWARR